MRIPPLFMEDYMKRNHNEESPVKMAIRDAVEIIAALIMFGVLLYAFLWACKACAKEVFAVAGRKAEVQSDNVSESADSMEYEATTYLGGYECPGEYNAKLEGFSNDFEVGRKDIGSANPAQDSLVYGWGDRKAARWEMELLSRIYYLEFWGTSVECCKAGFDAIMNLWASGYFGETLGTALAAENGGGYYVFSTYPGVWDVEYDPDGLQWCRDFCYERFAVEPESDVMYFRLYWYHDISWSTPRFEIDGVYFSAGRSW